MTPTTSAAPARASARERLLDAADELFYEDGIHSVGIDRVIERAGVAKATLYSTFGSKDELVRAYLLRRHERWRARMLAGLERYETPRERLLGVFDVLAETAASPTFRGCYVVNANAESPRGAAVEEVSDLARADRLALFETLAREAGVDDPAQLAAVFMLLYDGAVVGSRLDHDAAVVSTARAVAEEALDRSG
ncbi:MAG TPA: helix-turn-helix domain-containing protein [Candidatus Nanopelagicales bacterium]|nr:helix-turn-helix domain-containing protein [Candidatus Nanopelagicales bacterium]